MGRYDRHCKWIIGKHGDAILRLGGLTSPIVSWHAAQAEIVEPTKLPDGFFDVLLAGCQSQLRTSQFLRVAGGSCDFSVASSGEVD